MKISGRKTKTAGVADAENTGKKKEPEKGIKFSRLVAEALPEMISFQLFTKVIVILLSGGISFLASQITSFRTDRLFTSSNLKNLFLSWQGYLLIAAWIAIILLYIVMDILVQMELCNDILTGQKDRFITNIKQGLSYVKKFLDPGGISILLYIIIAIPLCGIGFAISLTRGSAFPTFMLEKVANTVPLFIIYWGGIGLLVVLGFLYIFSVHGVIIDGLRPKLAKKQSIRIMQEHWHHFIPVFVLNYIVVRLITWAAYYVFAVLPLDLMQHFYSDIPSGAVVRTNNISDVVNSVFQAEPVDGALWIRFLTCFVVLMGTYIYFIITITTHAYLMLLFTKLYRQYRYGPEEYEERWKLPGFWTRIIILLVTIAVVAVAAFTVALSFNDYIVYGEEVKVIAHRAGGNKAPENSLEGIEAAVEGGIYGSEIDIQKTKDGRYVVCHDSNLKRLAGIDKKIRDMTLEEIQSVILYDAGGQKSTIPTLEEALDAAKGREMLYLEIKGDGADSGMVDDIVRIVKERDQQDEVALVSMKYNLVDYAEKTYPEFETGFIYYANYGHIRNMNCDMLIMEETIVSMSAVTQAHRQGKSVIAWTINSHDLLYKYMNTQAYALFGGNIDGIITDDIDLADNVQKELDDRSDIVRIKDAFYELRI